MNAQWLYVYGTLRPGGVLFNMLEHTLLMPPFDNVRTRGRMYHCEGSTAEHPMFPVVDFSEDGTVVGTLMLVRVEQLGQVRMMELGAGYHEAHVAVVPDGWHHAATALTFHYPHPWRGEPVPDGDWLHVVEVSWK